MKSIATKLNNKEMEAVTEYLATLNPSQNAVSKSLALLTLVSPSSNLNKEKYFRPPSEKEIPDNEFGRVVREGRDIFIDTQTHAKEYVGNSLNCVNCHLDAGRLANSSPLWGAYVLYPAYFHEENCLYDKEVRGHKLGQGE